MDRKVVITGIGVISPIGIGKESYWYGLFKGKEGFKSISLFDTASYNVHIAGEIDNFDPILLLGKKGLRTLDRSTRLISAAAKLSIDDANLQITNVNSNFMGVSIGTTFGSLHSISQFDREGLVEGPRYVNPSHFPNTVINSPASQISIRFGIKGFNTTISTGFCASLDAFCYAVDFIRLKRANMVLTGGVEELCEETFLGFHNLGLLSGSDGGEPKSSPFDAKRNGLILSEGGAVLVIEDKEHAMQRGADILAEVLGYGNAFDSRADKDFLNAGQGLRNAITEALKDASLSPDDIGCISSSANSTRGLDLMETKVIKKVFGERSYEIPVSSIKSMIGESFSASGAFSLSGAVGILRNGIIPPTLNYSERDPECDLDYVPNIARTKRIETVLITAADPYGQNSSVILGKYAG